VAEAIGAHPWSDKEDAVSDQRPDSAALLRRFMLGSGPLKRTSDRLQHLGRILLLGVLLTGVAVALAVATAGYTEAAAKAAVQSASRHQVKAELTEDASPPSVNTSDMSGRGSASVTWRDAAGAAQHAVLSVPAGARAGSTMLVWVDRSGHRTTRPISRGDAVYAGIGYGVLTYLAIAGVAVAAYRLFRGSLDRGRIRRWDAEWAQVEPVWSRTVP
jgi:hypothetical protein